MIAKPVSSALPKGVLAFARRYAKLLAALAQWATAHDVPETGSLTVHLNCGGVTAIEKREVTRTKPGGNRA